MQDKWGKDVKFKGHRTIALVVYYNHEWNRSRAYDLFYKSTSWSEKKCNYILFIIFCTLILLKINVCEMLFIIITHHCSECFTTLCLIDLFPDFQLQLIDIITMVFLYKVAVKFREHLVRMFAYNVSPISFINANQYLFLFVSCYLNSILNYCYLHVKFDPVIFIYSVTEILVIISSII